MWNRNVGFTHTLKAWKVLWSDVNVGQLVLRQDFLVCSFLPVISRLSLPYGILDFPKSVWLPPEFRLPGRLADCQVLSDCQTLSDCRVLTGCLIVEFCLAVKLCLAVDFRLADCRVLSGCLTVEICLAV